MAEQTGIEWCDSTFNPWTGCTKVGPGCDHCYAESWAKRGGTVQWGSGAPRRRTTEANWRKPLLWEREHEAFMLAHGRRRRVFCASLADVFDNEVSEVWRWDLFDLIDRTPHLDWLLLTKRIGNAAKMLPWTADDETPGCKPLPNVWLGATVVNQAEADRDIPKLLATPAAVRFLSIEPMLGPIDLTDISDGTADSSIPRHFWTDMDSKSSPPAVGHNALTGERWQRFGDWSQRGARLDWTICGGESGHHARPMHPDWARSVRDQCAAAGVPFMFKQNGEFASVSEVAGPGDHHHFPDGATVRRVGKKAAGRLLDGRTHDEFPEAP